jgi:hypothetical protein
MLADSLACPDDAKPGGEAESRSAASVAGAPKAGPAQS